MKKGKILSGAQTEPVSHMSDDLVKLAYEHLQQKTPNLDRVREVLGDPGERVKVETTDDLKVACKILSI